MDQGSTTEHTAEAVERGLQAELARADQAIASASPVLRHLLGHHDQALLDDELVATIRGMILDVARQLLEAHAREAGAGDVPGFVAQRRDGVLRQLLDDAELLAHAHALAVEARVLERLREHCGIDPVLSPLVQELAADAEATVAGLAMAVLAAQARFMQYQRRMELPLRDLPADLFHRALVALTEQTGEHDGAAASAEQRLRDSYSESDGRQALLARLVSGLGARRAEALSIDLAAASIFATALAACTSQPRDRVVLSLAGPQRARLAVSLRAAGMEADMVAIQFALLWPNTSLPSGFELLDAGEAAMLLGCSAPGSAH
jgi:hypothetical protein